MPKTLYQKLWDAHRVTALGKGKDLIYIDRHLLHEVTSPQAFSGLKLHNRKPWRVDGSLAVLDHNVPTINRHRIDDPVSKKQIERLEENCQKTGIPFIPMQSQMQGIVHIIGPELGVCLPGMTIVCGDSHTATNGALGALAIGIGTSEVEQVLATHCLALSPAPVMQLNILRPLPAGISAKDLILAIIGKFGTAVASGYALEYAGSAVQHLSMEERMTVCNMSIELGARVGFMAVDETTLRYVADTPRAPRGALWDKAEIAWRSFHSDHDAHFDHAIEFDAATVAPQVTWGTSPDMVVSVTDCVPDPKKERDKDKRNAMEQALDYMGLTPSVPIESIMLDKVFIGSCTNARLSDLRAAARMIKGRRIAKNIKQALVVPGSGMVKKEAETEKLDQVFLAAGFEWREPGCSMCLGMNPDRLGSRERCASTSNRNFEGRQGKGGRTHLVSPETAAASAIAGHFVDVRSF